MKPGTTAFVFPIVIKCLGKLDNSCIKVIGYLEYFHVPVLDQPVHNDNDNDNSSECQEITQPSSNENDNVTSPAMMKMLSIIVAKPAVDTVYQLTSQSVKKYILCHDYLNVYSVNSQGNLTLS